MAETVSLDLWVKPIFKKIKQQKLNPPKSMPGVLRTVFNIFNYRILRKIIIYFFNIHFEFNRTSH